MVSEFDGQRIRQSSITFIDRQRMPQSLPENSDY